MEFNPDAMPSEIIVQVEPPSTVFKMMDWVAASPPAIYPVSAVGKEIDVSTLVVPLGGCNQFDPPSVVFNISPSSPAMKPVLASLKNTQRRYEEDPLCRCVQLTPPSVVFRIVPTVS